MKVSFILVPVDFSDIAENSFLYALELAKAFGASVKIIHVYHIPSMMHAGAAIDEKIKLEMQKEVQLKLKEFTLKHKDRLKGIAYQAEEVHGYFEQEVMEILKEEPIDLVVMGTEGASGLKKLIGSNTYHVMTKSPCPVLAVPPAYPFQGIRRIVFACNIYAPLEPDALRILKTFAHGFHAKVEIVHVQEDLRVGDTGQKKVMARLNAQLEGIDYSFKLLKGDVVDSSLQEFLKNQPADLLYLVPRHHDMWEHLFKGSVTRELAFHSHLPILTLKSDT